MEGNLISVHSPTVWPNNCTQSFLKSDVGSSEVATGEGDTACSVPGWHLSHSQFPWSTKRSYQDGSRVPTGFEVYAQREKVCLQASTNDRISRVYGEFCPNEDFSPLSESERLSEAMQEFLRLRTVSGRDVDHLIGKMTATIPAILPAALHYRALQRLKNRILWRSRQK